MNRKLKIEDSHFVPIVGDGGIATAGTAEGRIIPVLILDCKNHKELLNHIDIHQSVKVGDVNSTWGVNKKNAFLLLEFLRPSCFKIGVKFDLETQFVLADGIVQARGVYLQSGDSGLGVVEGLGQPKVLIEIPPGTKLHDWDKVLLAALTKRFKRKGLRKRQAMDAAKEALNLTRGMWGVGGVNVGSPQTLGD